MSHDILPANNGACVHVCMCVCPDHIITLKMQCSYLPAHNYRSDFICKSIMTIKHTDVYLNNGFMASSVHIVLQRKLMNQHRAITIVWHPVGLAMSVEMQD